MDLKYEQLEMNLNYNDAQHYSICAFAENPFTTSTGVPATAR